MKSIAIVTSDIALPEIEGEFSMIPFDLHTLIGISGHFRSIAEQLLKGVRNTGGEAFLTVHGKKLHKGETLRRGGAHTDGNYDKKLLGWGGGWKVGENGPTTDSEAHSRLYNSETGGIILASNFESCLGWVGDYSGLPGVGGDCSKIELDKPFMLKKNAVYYGNNHFVHESLPVSADVYRVFARITMPENHTWNA